MTAGIAGVPVPGAHDGGTVAGVTGTQGTAGIATEPPVDIKFTCVGEIASAGGGVGCRVDAAHVIVATVSLPAVSTAVNVTESPPSIVIRTTVLLPTTGDTEAELFETLHVRGPEPLLPVKLIVLPSQLPGAYPVAFTVTAVGEIAVGTTTRAVVPGFTKFTFDVVGDASGPTTQLFFDFTGNNGTLLVDQMSLSPTPGPATETTDGSIAFSDVETSDTHTAGFTPDGSGYIGTFSLDPVTESSGSGSFAWHYSVGNADIQFLAQGQTLLQSYSVSITDSHGASTVQDVTIAIAGSNDAPTAVNDNVIADAGVGGTIDIQPWMLTANDTDPDTIDHLSVNAVGAGTGGTAAQFGDVFFFDDATLGGSFTYTNTDGHVTSNSATATVINNATSVTALTGTSGDDIIIATNSAVTLNGGDGNDILVGNFAGSHVMTGGSGNDTFAFLHTTNGPATITDFNNMTEHDHIAISASGFGGGLSAGMDVTSIFESTANDQFSLGGFQFHFDTGNQTLYYSADGTTASAITVATVQAGVLLHPHDLLIV